jgi:hypothetical protein
MLKETRGRKRLPENKRKKPITLFLTTEDIILLGGDESAKNMLQNYSSLKIKQNAKKQIISNP